MTEEERMRIINERYEQDKAQITKGEMKFGNMNYYLKKEEYIRKHLWKTEKELKAGKKVEVEIQIIYSTGNFSKRPERFIVEYKVDGKRFIKRFKNN